VLAQLNGDSYVVYGVVTEICVLYAVRGLLKLGKPVTVVTDAIETLKAEDSEQALQECRQGGAALARASEICGG
jgi:nicotinamidase-related amidase